MGDYSPAGGIQKKATNPVEIFFLKRKIKSLKRVNVRFIYFKLRLAH